MSLWQAVLNEFIDSNSAIVILCYFFTLIIIKFARLQDNKGILTIGLMVAFHLILVPIGASYHLINDHSYTEINLACLLFGVMSLVSMACLVIFRVVLFKI